MESDGVEDCCVFFRRSFVVRVDSSAERRVLDDGAEASGASGLAGCVGGNGARGAVAHPAKTATTAETGKIREMNMDFSVFVRFHFRCSVTARRNEACALIQRAPL